MIEDIHDPLNEYKEVFRDRFLEVAKSTFDELAKEAKINQDHNRETCLKIYKNEEQLTSIKSRLTAWRVVCVLLWIAVGAGILFVALKSELAVNTIVYIVAAVLVLIVLELAWIHPKIKKYKTQSTELETLIQKDRDDAWRQMSKLNRLYDWDILPRMMVKTVPKIEFDPYFTTQRLMDLQKVYEWDGSFNRERSVIYSISGLIRGNPFVICRTRKMEMGTKTYTGYKTIYWTTRERDSDGNWHTVQHSQTLSANYTAPYPGYYEATRLIYGNTAAPDLIFERKQSGLASKAGSLSYKIKTRKLRRKARKLSQNDFAMMTNEDFEVAFDTSNRNNNQQFALLFTPLAQENMLKLLKDDSAGYGDDFNFYKHLMINTITADHMQDLNLDMNPDRFHHFDFEKAQKLFISINAEHFRALYFCLAPLLCIPMYQQIRSQEDIYGRDMKKESCFWEHEALANYWGDNRFKHPSCATQCILKTAREGDKVKVYAHGYYIEKRVAYVQVWGGDGNLHSVAVPWDEYLPITGTGSMAIKEDNEIVEGDNSSRYKHIQDVLRLAGLDIYRRHIASKCN